MAQSADGSVRIGIQRGQVPLAWRNTVANPRRLLRSTSGIAFAVLLMLLELGFRGAFLDSALNIIYNIDGDLILTSSTKFRFGLKESFSRRQLYAARGVEGVEWVRPIFAEWTDSTWKNPQTGKLYTVQVLAFDPDEPVFSFPEVRARVEELRQPDTAFADRRARRFLGNAPDGSETELARRRIRIIGNFTLGPDFTTNGTLIISDRTFLKFFPPRQMEYGDLPDVEFGVVKVKERYDAKSVERALRRVLPTSIAVRSKWELLALETAFQKSVSPVGPIFLLGTIIGFVVGMMISYQILYTDLSDQMPQYATLKAMGYEGGYLTRVVLQQAGFYALVGFAPALLLGIVAYGIIGEIALLPLHMTIGIALGTLALTLAMCVLSGMLAVRRVLALDPAEVF